MFAGDHTIERASQRHNARNGGVRLLQHLIVVTVHWQISVNVAVACMHMQRHPHAATQHFFVNRLEAIHNGLERFSCEDVFEWSLDFRLP